MVDHDNETFSVKWSGKDLTDTSVLFMALKASSARIAVFIQAGRAEKAMSVDTGEAASC